MARHVKDAFSGTITNANAAATAGRLATARKITFAGSATGSVSFDGSADVTVTLTAVATSAQFLAAHPVGTVFEWTNATNPGSVYGGTWQQRPSLGAFKYERTA